MGSTAKTFKTLPDRSIVTSYHLPIDISGTNCSAIFNFLAVRTQSEVRLRGGTKGANPMLSSHPLHVTESCLGMEYTCDRCKQTIHPTTDLRYTLTIELEAAGEGDEVEIVDESDTASTLDELQELIDSADAACSSVFDDAIYQIKQFDLCKCCFQAYIKNPLAREPGTVEVKRKQNSV